MEPDSTTFDTSPRETTCETRFPFTVSPQNYQLYSCLTTSAGDKSLERQIVERLQGCGLLRNMVTCPTGKPECVVQCRNARVIDRAQWVCSGCGSRQSVRQSSFFQKLQCSLLQALQIMLAWSEDAVLEVAAEHFGVKYRVANLIYYKLTELARKDQNACRLGGGGSVVLAALYPACVDRVCPDTTDQPQPHQHTVLMLADTNHVPTRYWLHVLKDDKKTSASSSDDYGHVPTPYWLDVIKDDKKTSASSSDDYGHLKAEIEEVVKEMTLPDSLLVTGHGVPALDGATTLQHLLKHCDTDMQQFLTSRIWQRAVPFCVGMCELYRCAMSREDCAEHAQRYLSATLFCARPNLFNEALRLLAQDTADQQAK